MKKCTVESRRKFFKKTNDLSRFQTFQKIARKERCSQQVTDTLTKHLSSCTEVAIFWNVTRIPNIPLWQLSVQCKKRQGTWVISNCSLSFSTAYSLVVKCNLAQNNTFLKLKPAVPHGIFYLCCLLSLVHPAFWTLLDHLELPRPQGTSMDPQGVFRTLMVLRNPRVPFWKFNFSDTVIIQKMSLLVFCQNWNGEGFATLKAWFKQQQRLE